MSRAYFAAFCRARNFALQHGLILKSLREDEKANVHRQVREHFKKDPPRRKVAMELDLLRQDRNRCDYDDDISELDLRVKKSFERVEKILESIRGLS